MLGDAPLGGRTIQFRLVDTVVKLDQQGTDLDLLTRFEFDGAHQSGKFIGYVYALRGYQRTDRLEVGLPFGLFHHCNSNGCRGRRVALGCHLLNLAVLDAKQTTEQKHEENNDSEDTREHNLRGSSGDNGWNSTRLMRDQQVHRSRQPKSECSGR